MRLLLSYLVFIAIVALAVWTVLEPSNLGARPTLRERVTAIGESAR